MTRATPTRRVTAAQMRELDRAAVEDYGIPALILMENAGSGAARFVEAFAAARGAGPRSAVIVCGRGNNGGDGFVVARHLHNRDWAVRILFDGDPEAPGAWSEETATNWRIVRALGLPVLGCEAVGEVLDGAELIVDALLGVGLTGEVRAGVKRIIEAVNGRGVPVVAVDVPSGLDCDTGLRRGAAVVATATATFGLPKVGFFKNDGPRCVGELHVVDIGLPPILTRRVP